MSELEDWMGEGISRTTEGHELYVGAEFKYGELVKVTLRDQTDGKELLEMYADEAGRLMLDLMSTLFTNTDRRAFEAQIEGLHSDLAEWRAEEEVRKQRDGYAISMYGVAYVLMSTQEQRMVDMIISRDQKIKELEKELNNVE